MTFITGRIEFMLEDLAMDIGIDLLGVTILTTGKTTSDMIRAAFISHPDVSDAYVIDVSDHNTGTIFSAHITLKGKTGPYQELKLDLGWHVVAEIGSCVKFKDIVIIDTNHNLVDDKRPLVIMPAQANGTIQAPGSSNVLSSEEAENALRTHPLVGDARVVRIPDNGIGEVLMAYVTLRSGVGNAEEIVSDIVWHIVSEVDSTVRFKNIMIVESIKDIQEKIDRSPHTTDDLHQNHSMSVISEPGNDHHEKKNKKFIQPFYWW